MPVPLLPEWLLFITLFGASLVKLRARHFEHAITRMALALLYIFIAVTPVAIEDVRILSRWLLWLMAVVEIVSFITFRISSRKNG